MGSSVWRCDDVAADGLVLVWDGDGHDGAEGGDEEQNDGDHHHDGGFVMPMRSLRR